MRVVLVWLFVVLLIIGLSSPVAAANKGTPYDFNGNGVYDCRLVTTDGLLKSWHSMYPAGDYVSYTYRSLDGKRIYGYGLLDKDVGETSYWWDVAPEIWVK